MKFRFIFIILVNLASTSFAQIVPEELKGTNQITFMPMQIEGKLGGCSLVFDAIILDQVYQNGDPVFVGGNITFYANTKGLLLGLKLGTTNITNKKPRAPYFAYLQTDSASTSKLGPKISDGDKEGFKLFFYPIKDEMFKVYDEMTRTKKVTIGYNYHKGGMDVLLPIDLTVKEVVTKGKINRKIHSDEMMRQFLDCSSKLADSIQKELH